MRRSSPADSRRVGRDVGLVLAVVGILVGLVALTVVVVLSRHGGSHSSGTQDRPVGGNAVILAIEHRSTLPLLAGPTVVGGGRFDVGTLRGHVVVLNFWASWCGPCRSEQPALAAASDRLFSSGVRFVGVNLRDNRAAAAAYLREFDVNYPSLFDPSGALTARLGGNSPSYPPFTLVADGQGRVVGRIYGALNAGKGPQTAQLAQLEALVQAARESSVPR